VSNLQHYGRYQTHKQLLTVLCGAIHSSMTCYIELDVDWIHPGLDWIGLDWVRSFVRFIVFSKMEAPSSSVFFR